MLKYLYKFLKYLEQWERYEPSSFWLCSIGLYISFSAGFGALFPESHSQSQVVIEQVRGGGREDSGSSTSSAYIPPGRTTPRQTNSGTQDKTIKSFPKEYEPKPGIRLGAGGNAGDSGMGPLHGKRIILYHQKNVGNLIQIIGPIIGIIEKTSRRKRNLKKKFAVCQTNLRTQLAQLLRNLTNLTLLKI